MDNLIPIDPEEFRTMKPGTEIIGKNEMSYWFMTVQPSGNNIMAACIIDSNIPSLVMVGVENWHRRPEPKPVIKWTAESGFDKKKGCYNINASGRVCNIYFPHESELEAGKTYTVKVYENE